MNQPGSTPFRLLGVEGGGTHTVALFCEGDQVQRWAGGPSNLRLLSDQQLTALLQEIARHLPKPQALAIGLAGARTKTDRARIRAAADKCWPGVPCYATNDLETGLAAQPESAEERAKFAARVLVLSGTGSCCYGQSATGKTSRVGGWGHVLGDRGSGYEIGLSALRKLIAEYDQASRWPRLGTRILRQVELNEPEDLIDWAQAAPKDEIAALAVEVFAAAGERDKLANSVIQEAKQNLAADAIACARQLAPPRAAVEFILAGGVLLKQPRFATAVIREIRNQWPGAQVVALKRESAWGAIELAETLARKSPETAHRTLHKPTERVGAKPHAPAQGAHKMLSLTEERNPRSKRLDRLSLSAGIQLMLSEDAKIPAAILAQRKPIEQALRLIVRSFKSGGRLFYAGAGTSGRLGVLDASECPPTFRTPPEMVQAIMAGGQRAIWESIEGAEDDAQAGAQAIEFREVTRRDVVVGIAASGTTPFVWGALAAARARGAKTVLLCFNPRLQVERARRPDVIIAIATGPEILTGSTRLKAGTATKLVLNIFTTLAMVQLGKVASNLMVDLNPSNAKLRDRAVRIVQQLTGADGDAAAAALEKSGWVVKKALKKLAFKTAS